VAYEDEQPLGQMALVRKGQFWWVDYLYVREDKRGRGVVPSLIKEMFPYAAEVTDYLWENCKGVLPKDLERNSKRYGLKMDVISTSTTKQGNPLTLVRRHIGAIRKKMVG
jgi:hypothetical protein